MILNSYFLMATSGTTKIIRSTLPNGNLAPSKILENLTEFIRNIANYALPFITLFAILIAAGYVLYSQHTAWKRIISATVGAIIVFSSVGFLTSLKEKIENEFNQPDMLQFLEILFIYLKEFTDGIMPIACLLALTTGAICVMFSSQTGWKRILNAILGSAISFTAVLIVNGILKEFNTF